MSLSTPFTRLVSIEHPIALAPMGGAAGGALAAAVSNSGGLGLIGGARGNRGWLERELAIVTARTGKPWGIGFLTWAIDIDTIAWALDQRPAAVMLAFGDPAPFAVRVRAAGVPLIIQVTDLDEAQRAVDAGADVIVAQGSEAGGHGAVGGRRCRSSPRLSISPRLLRCWPPVGSPMVAAWPPRSRSVLARAAGGTHAHTGHHPTSWRPLSACGGSAQGQARPLLLGTFRDGSDRSLPGSECSRLLPRGITGAMLVVGGGGRDGHNHNRVRGCRRGPR